jgi:hypothetical protein
MTKEKFIIHKIVCDETNNTQKDIDNGVAILSGIVTVEVDVKSTPQTEQSASVKL